MRVHSRVREIAAIVAVAAALVGAQLGAHVFFPLDNEALELHMWLGGGELVKLGMAEASARAVLSQRYDLLKSAGEKYYLRAKDGESLWMKGAIPSERIEGAVWFHQGKLARLSRDLYRGDTAGTDATAFTAFAMSVQNAIMVATDLSRARRCEVSTELRKSSSAEVTETDISCGRRTVRIQMSRAPGARTARLQVSEEIQ